MNMTTFKTLVLREYWENKSFQRAPLIIAGVILFSMIVGLFTAQTFMVRFGDELNFDADFSVLSQADVSELGVAMKAFQFGAILAPLTIGLIFVLFFYVLGSLYNERRDRSILFWKSMPVSDTQTVLSKVFSAFVVAPVLTAAVAVVSQIIGLMLLTLMVWFNGGSAWDLIWSNASLFSVIFNDFALLIVMALWMAPVLGWLWLVSAYAKRAAFLIAVFVPLGLMLIEGMIFHSAHFASLIGEHFSQIEPIVESAMVNGHPFGALARGGMWIGLIICALCVAGAIYIRRFRDDSY